MIDRFTYAFGLGLAIAALFNAALVLAKERLPGLLDWMNALTGHHWLTHSLLAMAVFLASGAILLLKRPGRASVLTIATAGATLASTVVIAGYYFFR